MPTLPTLRRSHGPLLAVAIGAVTVLAACGGGGTKVATKRQTTTSTSTTVTTLPPSTAAGIPNPEILKFATDQTLVPCNGTKASTLTLSWVTQNTLNINIRIDGPNVFSTEPPNGSAVVPYACPAQKHTYLLTANGTNGQVVGQSIVVRTLSGPAPPPTSAPTTAPPTTVAPTTPTTAPVVTPITAEFTSPGKKQFALSVAPVESSNGAVEFKVTNSSAAVQNFIVLKTDTPFDQLPVDPHTHRVSEVGKVGEIKTIDRNDTKTLSLTLQPGKYVLLANEPYHYQRGARAAFEILVTTSTS